MKRKIKRKLKEVVSNIKKVGTLNLVLISVGIFFIWFNWQMILLYKDCGSMPESYACAVVAATIGECGICGWIRTTKDKKLDRKWQKQDEREARDVPDINADSIEDDTEDSTEEDMEENEDDEH